MSDLPRFAASPRDSLRTYVVLTLADAVPSPRPDRYGAQRQGTDSLRPLGTVAAPARRLAKAAAQLLHPGVAPGALRVVAAASAPGTLLVRALAADAAI